MERRLGTPLQTLAQFVAAGGDVKQQLAKYGQAKDGGLNEASSDDTRAAIAHNMNPPNQWIAGLRM